MAPQQRALPPVLNDRESEAFRATATHARDQCAVCLMLDMGLRVSECAGIRLPQIDWNSQVLRFLGKGGRPAELPIPSRVKAAIEDALRHRPATATHDYLLWNLRHPERPISRFGLWKLVRRLGLKALGRAVHPHQLRHTFGSQLYRRYTDLAVVQRALRHVNPTTSAIYVHISTDQQRTHFEVLDTRPWWVKWWGRLRPTHMPDTFKVKKNPLVFGETIGREKELTQLRANLRRRVHSVLVGERESGRRHLLGLLDGERVYRVERLAPLRETLVELCAKLVGDGHLTEMPKGRSSTPFVRALVQAGKTADFTLAIDSLDNLTKQEVRAVEQVAQTWVIFGAVEPGHKATVERAFFGRASFIEVGNLNKNECLELGRKAIAKAGLSLADEQAYLNHLWAESHGNPGALLTMVEQSQKTGTLTPEHTGARQVLSATPLLTAIWTAVVISRYPASALSEPQWKVWASIIIFGLLPFILLDRLLRMRRRK